MGKEVLYDKNAAKELINFILRAIWEHNFLIWIIQSFLMFLTTQYRKLSKEFLTKLGFS